MIKKFFVFMFIATSSVAFEYENQNSISLNTNYFTTNYVGADQTENQLQLTTENNFKLTSELKLIASPLVDVYYGSAEKKLFTVLDAKDFRFLISKKNFSVDVGFFNVKKMGPDVMDPLGYFEPSDLTHILNSKKMSVGGLRLETELLKDFIFTGVYVPENRLSKLPRTSSMWYPRDTKLPLTTDDTKATLPLETNYRINTNQAEKKSDLQNNYLIQLKYTLNDLEVDLQMAESVSNVPQITPTLTGSLVSVNPTEIALQNPIELDILWKKNKNYGTGLVYSFSDAGLIAKAFFNLSVTPDNETQQSVFAIEKQFQDLVLIYEFSKSQTTQSQNSSTLVSTNTLFANAHAVAARYSATERFKIKLAGYLDTTEKSNLWLLAGEYHFTDDIYLEVQKTEINGSGNSLLSYFDKNDSYSLKLTALF
jgi:hypothetical protein